MKKSILILGLALSAIGLASGCGADSQSASVSASASPPPVELSNEPVAVPSSSAVVAKNYASIEDLRDDYASTGVDCSGWQQTDDYSAALASGSCSDSDLLALFENQDAVLASLEAKAKLMYEFELDYGAVPAQSLLVGDNWTINSDDAEGLALKLGGEVRVITADSYAGAPEIEEGASNLSGPIIEDGSWLVGTDFPAGEYTLAESPVDSCYWGIYEGGSNQDEIIANDNVDGGYPTVVLEDDQEFESSDCGTWFTQPEARNLTEFGNGTWTVGRDIQPGRYRVTDSVSDGCYWAVLKSKTNGDDILSNDNVASGKPNVTLKKGQDFTTSDCGTWAPL